MANAICCLFFAIILAAGLRLTCFIPFESSLLVLLITMEAGVVASAVNKLCDRVEDLHEKPKSG